MIYDHNGIFQKLNFLNIMAIKTLAFITLTLNTTFASIVNDNNHNKSNEEEYNILSKEEVKDNSERKVYNTEVNEEKAKKILSEAQNSENNNFIVEPGETRCISEILNLCDEEKNDLITRINQLKITKNKAEQEKAKLKDIVILQNDRIISLDSSSKDLEVICTNLRNENKNYRKRELRLREEAEQSKKSELRLREEAEEQSKKTALIKPIGMTAIGSGIEGCLAAAGASYLGCGAVVVGSIASGSVVLILMGAIIISIAPSGKKNDKTK